MEKPYFKIIKEQQIQEYSGWYNKVITRTPYYFADNQEQKHFVLNLASDTGYVTEDREKRRELAALLYQLRENKGSYITLYSRKKMLPEFFDWVRKENYTLEVHGKGLFVFDNPSFVDFHGNIVEYSATFFYRIYTRETLEYVFSQLRTIKRQKSPASSQ